MDANFKAERNESKFAKGIEKQISKIPSDIFLWTALGSMALSMGLRLAGKKSQSQFVVKWAVVMLIRGLYNKVNKTGRTG